MAESTQALTQQALDEARLLRQTAAKLEEAVRGAGSKRAFAEEEEEEDVPIAVRKKKAQSALGRMPRRPRPRPRSLTGDAGPTLYQMALERLRIAKREGIERLPSSSSMESGEGGGGLSCLHASAVRSHLTAPLVKEAMGDHAHPVTHIRIGRQHMAYDLTTVPRMIGNQQYAELRNKPGFQAHLLTCYLDCIARNGLTQPPKRETEAARARWCEAYLGITICRALEQKAFKEYSAMAEGKVNALAAQFHSAIQFGAGRH